ncbi:hypothetical protein AVEN_179468-1 [Araneus ventricosus]|uniref:Uncharacterized protein n=1 Tax=Araneus ventricosus TaxID=182803 RepID=A0A4Y2BFN7_ARAVE|nr:hypothetical protein AVEN_179468-1 [Araneus ventricosus]
MCILSATETINKRAFLLQLSKGLQRILSLLENKKKKRNRAKKYIYLGLTSSSSVQQGKRRPRWPSCKVSALGPEGFQVRNPILLKIRHVLGLLHVKSYVREPSVLPLVWCGSSEKEGVPAQVSSSSSDQGSKLRDPSQNSPRVASKRDVNITKTKARREENSQIARTFAAGLIFT